MSYLRACCLSQGAFIGQNLGCFQGGWSSLFSPELLFKPRPNFLWPGPKARNWGGHRPNVILLWKIPPPQVQPFKELEHNSHKCLDFLFTFKNWEDLVTLGLHFSMVPGTGAECGPPPGQLGPQVLLACRLSPLAIDLTVNPFISKE